jgi:hypothetical protein
MFVFYIVYFFKLVSCIDMNLEFYVTLVFIVLLDFITWSSWSSINSRPAFTIVRNT